MLVTVYVITVAMKDVINTAKRMVKDGNDTGKILRYIASSGKEFKMTNEEIVIMAYEFGKWIERGDFKC